MLNPKPIPPQDVKLLEDNNFKIIKSYYGGGSAWVAKVKKNNIILFIKKVGERKDQHLARGEKIYMETTNNIFPKIINISLPDNFIGLEEIPGKHLYPKISVDDINGVTKLARKMHQQLREQHKTNKTLQGLATMEEYFVNHLKNYEYAQMNGYRNMFEKHGQETIKWLKIKNNELTPVHMDLNNLNIIKNNSNYKFIDAKGGLSHPVYDLAWFTAISYSPLENFKLACQAYNVDYNDYLILLKYACLLLLTLSATSSPNRTFYRYKEGCINTISLIK